MKEAQYRSHCLLSRFHCRIEVIVATYTLNKSQACLIVHFRNLNSLLRTRKQVIGQKAFSTSIAIFPDSKIYNNSQYDTSQRNPV